MGAPGSERGVGFVVAFLFFEVWVFLNQALLDMSVLV